MPDTQSAPAIESLVLFRNSQGDPGRGALVRVSPHLAVFEVYNPYSIVQLSEVLEELCIQHGEDVVYQGRAVVSNLMNTGVTMIVSAALVDAWVEATPLRPGPALREEAAAFVEAWESRAKTLEPRFQVTVGRMASFCQELRRWLTHAEMAASLHNGHGNGHGNGREGGGPRGRGHRRGNGNGNGNGSGNGNGNGHADASLHDAFAHDVSNWTLPKLRELMEEFEHAGRDVPEPARPAHKAFAQRELHPLLLCSPFIHRTFTKPLGYAGDYEMVDMMFRDPWEGEGTYARIINAWLIQAAPAEGHRNRVARLTEYLKQQAQRHARSGRDVRILNVGSGPAIEIQRFIRQSSASERCHFDLVDFNDETLEHARRAIDEAIYTSRHRPNVRLIHESIHNLLKRAGRTDRHTHGPADHLRGRDLLQTPGEYDLIYCAGLFDYLSDRICHRLLKLFLHALAPQGLIVASNVHPANPIRQFMEHLLEWNLIHRDEHALLALVPAHTRAKVTAEPTGTNILLELRHEQA